jgi:hypothetical protein
MLPSMFPKPLLFALLAAIGVHTGPEANPNPGNPGEQPIPIQPPTVDGGREQHFCCKVVDVDKRTGEECVTISKKGIDSCAEVLFCPGFFAKHAGVVTCE